MARVANAAVDLPRRARHVEWAGRLRAHRRQAHGDDQPPRGLPERVRVLTGHQRCRGQRARLDGREAPGSQHVRHFPALRRGGAHRARVCGQHDDHRPGRDRRALCPIIEISNACPSRLRIPCPFVASDESLGRRVSPEPPVHCCVTEMDRRRNTSSLL